jgi:hypothetical protein
MGFLDVERPRNTRKGSPMKTVARVIGLAGAVLVMTSEMASANLMVYSGNGNSGFDGAVGTGNLSISDTPTSMKVTFNRGSGAFNDDLVIYLDTPHLSGGFSSNATFNDNADGGRTAISGANNGNPSRSLVTFAPSFSANYAISIQDSFIGVFGLSATGSHNFLFGASQSGNNSDASYSITMSAAQMGQIGLTAGSGGAFSFEGTYISATAFRSDETIGASSVVGNPGFSGSLTFSKADSFALTAVPEPSTLIGAAIGALMALGYACKQRRAKVAA